MATVMSSPLIMLKLKDGRREGARFCSGVLVAGKGGLPQVLTAHQCFRKNLRRETSDLVEDACANTVVYFDKYNAQPKEKDDIVPKLERKCKNGSLQTSFEGDMAVFTLSAALPSDYTTTEIWSDDELPANRKVFAIYYPSNPKADGVTPSRIKGGFNGIAPPKLMNLTKCRIEGRIPSSIHQDPKLKHFSHKLPYAVAHNCYLAKPLGAGLIDIETGKLLALHFGYMQAGNARINLATHALHLRQFLNGEKISLP